MNSLEMLPGKFNRPLFSFQVCAGYVAEHLFRSVTQVSRPCYKHNQESAQLTGVRLPFVCVLCVFFFFFLQSWRGLCVCKYVWNWPAKHNLGIRNVKLKLQQHTLYRCADTWPHTDGESLSHAFAITWTAVFRHHPGCAALAIKKTCEKG